MSDENRELIPDYLKNLDEYKIDINETDENQAKICLWYETEGGTEIPVAAKGEILVVTGLQKSRKTLLAVCMLLASYTDDENRTLGFITDLEEDEYILHFDTEQPKERVKKNKRRFHKIIGLNEDESLYETYAIKKLSPQEKRRIILKIVQNHLSLKHRIGIILIDQIADLIPGRDVNDQTGASEVIDILTTLHEITGALLIVSIHTNRGGEQTNGKIGALLDQKADGIFHIKYEKDSGVSECTHKDSREYRIPNFRFEHDRYGRPVLLSVDDYKYDEF